MATRIIGLEKLERKLDKIQNLHKRMQEPATKARRIVKKQAEKYPPPKPTYKRTFTLKRSWRSETKRTSNGYRITVYSSGANQGWGDYEQYVKGENGRQAWMHQGHWNTVGDDADAVIDNVLDIFREFLADAVND